MRLFQLILFVLLLLPKTLFADSLLSCDELMAEVRKTNGEPDVSKIVSDDYQNTTVWYYKATRVKISFVSIKNKSCYKVVEHIPLSKDDLAKIAEARAQEIKKTHPKWSLKVCRAVAESKIYIGMTEEQVKESWGDPERINRTITMNEVTEQWVMSGGLLYFEKGILTTIQSK